MILIAGRASVIIGNGITDISTSVMGFYFTVYWANYITPSLYPGRYDVACGRASLKTPLLDIQTCVRMKQAVSNITKAGWCNLT